MPQMTLVEYAKGLDMGDASRRVVEVFAESADVNMALPFETFSGASYELYREGAKPSGLAFRGINEAPTSGLGRMDPHSEASYPIDHHADVDDAIVRRFGAERRYREEKLSIKAVGRLWANTFMNGDNETEPREFNGLVKRVALYGANTAQNTRILHNAAGSGGAALSLGNLDRLLNMVNGATHIIAPRNMIPRWTAAARNTTISGFVMQTWDGVGMPKMTYAGRPILFGYEREPNESEFLDFNEVASGGGDAVTCSIYAAKFGDNGLRGIQLINLSGNDLGKLEDGITWRTHVQWDTGLVDEHPFCLARLTSITDAAIVA